MSRTYHFQREGAASDASRKRKNRGRKEGDVVKGEKKRIRKVTTSKAAAAYAWLVGRWQKDLISGGTNNATSLAALVRVLDLMAEQKPFSSRSVFIDMGSGCGLPCIYTALRYGCRVVGVEKDEDLVALARTYADDVGVGALCSFVCCGFETLGTEWLTERNTTHVFCYDGVFRAATWNTLFHTVLTGADGHLVGASASKYRVYWPKGFELVGKVKGVKLSASKSSFTLGVWVMPQK